MADVRLVLDEFYFFKLGVYGILRDVLRGLGIFNILSKILFKRSFLLV